MAQVTDISVEEFLESMQVWASRCISKTARHNRSNVLLSREDLMQEARSVLTEVWYMYVGGWCRGCKLPSPGRACATCGDPSMVYNEVTEPELRRIGGAAVYKHVGNLYLRSRAVKRGRDVSFVTTDAVEFEGPGGAGKENLQIWKKLYEQSRDLPLERLILIEAVDTVASWMTDDERRSLETEISPSDLRPARGIPGDGKTFQSVKKKLQDVLTRDGYLDVRAYAVTTKPKREESMETQIESPDVAQAPSTETVEKPKRSHKKKFQADDLLKPRGPRPSKKDARQSATQTKQDSKAFKKGQSVEYLGGGRAGWLKKGVKLEVLGTVMSRGRMYVRCVTARDKKKVSLSSLVIK